jgi:hypothetical protein
VPELTGKTALVTGASRGIWRGGPDIVDAAWGLGVPQLGDREEDRMTAHNATVTDVIRSYYRAYETSDRALAESLLSDDFTFSSPVDDGIDRATFFAKCWPFHEQLRTFHLLQLGTDGRHALIRYRAEKIDGDGFCNVEHLELDQDRRRISHIDVYFGALPGTDDDAPSS